MKKLLALFLAIPLLLSLASCGHRHTVENWHLNQYTHWHVCTGCKKKTDEAPHEFRSNGICVVCNASVTENSGGGATVTVYDTDGKTKLKEYVFDDEGNMLDETVFNNSDNIT